MSITKIDRLDQCNQTKMPVTKHMELKCSSCKKSDCVRAAKAAK